MSERSPSACCVLLRCKSLYYRADERPGLLHTSDVMTYWCDRTAADLGPDDEVAGHTQCQPGRGCFEPGDGQV